MDLQPYSHDRFSKNIESFLCKQKLVNNCSITSTHFERKITVHSHKHSFTPYPSLSPYSQTGGMTDRETNTLAARGLEELFSSHAVVSVFGSGRKQVLVYILMYLEYNTVVVLCQFFSSGGKQFLVLRTYLVYNTLCCCVSFLVVAGNNSQNEDTFLPKKLLGYFIMIRQPMCVFYKT